jgi:UDP-2-acetamido-3-amino-2,3-dideoxy-glucuronate N-acetyltransferase
MSLSPYKGITLEDGVFCRPSAVSTPALTPRAGIERKSEFKLEEMVADVQA